MVSGWEDWCQRSCLGLRVAGTAWRGGRTGDSVGTPGALDRNRTRQDRTPNAMAKLVVIIPLAEPGILACCCLLAC